MQSGRLFLVSILALFLLACPSAVFATQVFNQVATKPAVVPVTGNVAFGNCGGPVIPAINPEFEQAVVEQTNEIRMQNGLPPLKRVEELDESARYHTADMSASDYFSHETLAHKDGKLVTVCDTWKRIESYYTNWLALAENIAAGQRTPEMAMEGWMNSPDHRHNILSDNYSEIGVGFYEGPGEYHFYWGQNFGRREGVFPLVIDGEKAQTSTNDVPVYVFGDFKSMRLRNDDGSWSEWMPFKNDFRWTLPDKPGTHTVTVELRGDGLRVASSSDTIELVK